MVSISWNAFSNRMCDRRLVSGLSVSRKVRKSDTFKLASISGVDVCWLGRMLARALLFRVSSVGRMLTPCGPPRLQVYVHACFAYRRMVLLRRSLNLQSASLTCRLVPSWMSYAMQESRNRVFPVSCWDVLKSWLRTVRSAFQLYARQVLLGPTLPAVFVLVVLTPSHMPCLRTIHDMHCLCTSC